MQVKLKCLLAFVLLVFLLTGCEFSSKSESIIVSGDFPIVYVKRPQNVIVNPTDSTSVTANSDLYFRDVSSPDSEEINLTLDLTLGKGDVADPEVSFDGKQIIFSLKCSTDSAPICNADTTWNIWIYDITTKIFRRVMDFDVANEAHDIDPAFLPNNRIVFSSTRQTGTLKQHPYVFTDEDQRLPISVLHTMDLNGSNIEQISFSRGHDRNPTVLQNGKIMFSRWEYTDNRSQLAIYTANPDGSEMNVLYGAHSPGDAFLHPRELPNGKVISTVVPIQGTWESGALMTIDVANYIDAENPTANVVDKSISGQQSATIQQIPLEKTVSELGRFTTPYPLLDSSNQVLVSFSFFQELIGSESVLDQLNSIDDLEAPPSFGIYVLNTEDKSLKPLVLAQANFSLTDPIAVFPRDPPAHIQRVTPVNPGVFDPTQIEGILNVKSVYDTDHFGRMGLGVLTAQEVAVSPIPLIEPVNSELDDRELVADLIRLKDPMQTTAEQRPARFIRVTQALPIPVELQKPVLGESDFVMRKIIGYAPVEPDGSVKVKVPADVPLSIAVLDKYGRAYENRSNWIQVRPGETLECNGCHAPNKNLPLNSPPIAGIHPNTQAGFAAGPEETMAETRTESDERALELTRNVLFTDVWTDPTQRTIDPSISYLYESLTTTPPTDGYVDYPRHIQPIWNATRTINGNSQSCTTCHNGITNVTNNPTSLDLNGFQGAGRMSSYNDLLVGQVLTGENGQPLFEDFGTTEVVRRAQPLVNAGFARGSYLVEKLFNTELFADKVLPSDGLDHSAMLTDAEKRLISEWIDIGAQYYNFPFDENNDVIEFQEGDDSLAVFATFHTELLETCAPCHATKTLNGNDNPGFVSTGFTLTRDLTSDHIVSLSQVTDRIDPDRSQLLARPSGASNDNQHWTDTAQTIPLLQADDELYTAIKSWIEGLGN